MWKQEAPPKRPVEPARPAEERRVVAWVGKSVIFRGELISSEDMTIDGRVEGTIDVRNHELTLGPDADIQASIVARQVTVFGAVTGSITADEAVRLRETASVTGDILAPRLAIADGARFQGRISTRDSLPPRA